VPAERCYRLPEGVDPALAVAVAHPAATAYLACFVHGGLRPGEVACVGGGAGNVGSAAIALGHWGYATPWVDAAIGLLALVVVIGPVGGQRPKQAPTWPPPWPPSSFPRTKSCAPFSVTEWLVPSTTLPRRRSSPSSSSWW
jgi:hypothetical protein